MLKLRNYARDRLLINKLELMVFYELVHSKKKCCFHLGNLASVTKYSCLNVSFCCCCQFSLICFVHLVFSYGFWLFFLLSQVFTAAQLTK